MADIKVAGKEALQTLWYRVYEEYPRGITKGTPSASGLPIHLRKGYDNNGTWTSTGNTDTMTLLKSDITALGIPGSNTTYSLTGAVASHKFTTTLTGSDNSTSESELELAAGTGITLTDSGNKITIATSGQANQNAFSNVKVGSVTIAANAIMDTIELVAGSNVTLTPSTANNSKKVTIAATDTTYGVFTSSDNGLVPKATSVGDYPFDVLTAAGAWLSLSEIIAEIATGSSTTGFLKQGSNSLEIDNSGSLMTSAQSTKLAGIATGAEVNQNAFSTVVDTSNVSAAASSKTDTLYITGKKAINTTAVTSGSKGIVINGQNIWHAFCDTAASTAAKVAVLDNPADYSLTAGITVAVTFKNGNSAATPTLNVKKSSSDSGSAKTIAYASSATAYATGEGTGINSWGAYETVLFTYTGTYWCRTDGRALDWVRDQIHSVPGAAAATKADGQGGTSDSGSGGSATTYARSDHSHALNVASSGTTAMDGTASLGSAHTYARTDHVHPHDTSKADVDSPVFTTKAELASGAIPATSDNSARIPSTSWVQGEISSAIGTISGNMVYKGTVSAASDLLNIPLKTGWLYVAAAAFAINGESLQVGDSIIIHTTTDPETYTTEADLDAHSDIIQTNTTLLKQSDMTGWFTINPPQTPAP